MFKLTVMENKKQNIELSDIFSSHAEDILQHHKLSSEQKKAFDAIMHCRTSVLGGHIDRCDNCGYTKQSYNSCRNRHCPKCQLLKKVQWVDKLAHSLPPVKHFSLFLQFRSAFISYFTSIRTRLTAFFSRLQGTLC